MHAPEILQNTITRLEGDARLDPHTERLGRAAAAVVGPSRRAALRGEWLGHALHPLLTDLPLERAGGAYYPKLQVTVPFTPCPGRRLLGNQTTALLAALESIVVQNELSSAHITFCTPEEVAAATLRG